MAAKKSSYYLTREQLVQEIILSKQKQRERPHRTPAECFTPNLITYLELMVNRYANKGQWRGYSYIDDMKSEALLILCQNAFKYNEEKFDNPFGYYTQIIKYCFITFLEKEELARDVKNSLWESIGMAPSYARQLSNERLEHAREAAHDRGLEQKTAKALKKDVDELNTKVDQLSRIIKLKTANVDADIEIAEILGTEVQVYTGDRQAALSLFIIPPIYEVEEAVIIGEQSVSCLTLFDETTKSNTKRVISDIEDSTVTLTLCSIGLTVRRDLLIKEIREISGYNLSTRIPITDKTYTEPEMDPEEYKTENRKRKPRKRKVSVE